MLGFGFVGLLLAFGALAFFNDGSDDSYSDTDDNFPPDPDDIFPPAPDNVTPPDPDDIFPPDPDDIFPPDPDDVTPPDPDEEPEIPGQGGPGDDLITARDDVSVYNGFAGNDTLIGFPEFGVQLNGGTDDDLLIALEDDHAFGGEGDDFLIGEHMDPGSTVQTLRGGGGNDTLVSAGGSEMTGGAGEDVFVVSPGGLNLTGAMQTIGGDALTTPVVRDFNPSEDRLVIDLDREFMSAFDDLPDGQYGPNGRDPLYFGDTVTLTAERTSDDSGVLIRVDGLPMVELEGFDGTDPSELLAAISVEVQGAEYSLALPEDVELPGTLIEPGLSQQLDEFERPTYYLNEDYVGDGLIEERAEIDLTLYQGDLSVTIDETGTVLIEDANDDRFSLTLNSVTRIFIGEGQNIVDASASGSRVSVYVASSGTENTIIGGSGPITIRSYAGGADIQLGAGEATVFAYSGNDTIIGGIGSLDILTADNGNSFPPDAFGERTNLFQAGPTMIEAVDADVSGRIGLGDTLALGEGPNNIVVYGFSPTDLGPAVITGFDPDSSSGNSFEYIGIFSELEPDGGGPAPTAMLEERGDDLFVVENGRDMVRFVNLSLADVQGMPADRFDLSQNRFWPVSS